MFQAKKVEAPSIKKNNNVVAESVKKAMGIVSDNELVTLKKEVHLIREFLKGFGYK